MHKGVVAKAGTRAEVMAAEAARITFTLLPGDADAVVPDLPGAVRTDITGGARARVVTVHTNDVQRTMTAVIAWASATPVTLHGLTARSASLEEAFLAVASSAAADTEVDA